MNAVTHILVAIDFGASSNRVLEYGRMLADACGASLHLLHVIQHPLEDSGEMARAREDACERLGALLDATDRERRRATVWCEAGTPAHEIARHAARHGIDLVVMGTHPHGPSFQMATGSIAEAVIGAVPCAVLTVKAAGPPAST
jgi:nucleotide-binding universal stress UspA family protein